MLFLLNQDDCKSIVVKKAINILMGFAVKKKKGNAKKKTNTSKPLAVLPVAASHPWDLTS